MRPHSSRGKRAPPLAQGLAARCCKNESLPAGKTQLSRRRRGSYIGPCLDGPAPRRWPVGGAASMTGQEFGGLDPAVIRATLLEAADAVADQSLPRFRT